MFNKDKISDIVYIIKIGIFISVIISPFIFAMYSVVNVYDHFEELTALSDTVKSQCQQISELSELSDMIRPRNVKLTYYIPERGGINSDSDPDKTATMTTPVPGRTIAISRSLQDAGWFGKRIYIQGIGVRVAEDLLSASIAGDQIDICAGHDIEIPDMAMAYLLVDDK